jgi:DNA-3-methyladenine glycosylase II
MPQSSRHGSVSPESCAEAIRVLAERDPELRRLIAAVGPCTLRPNPDGFHVLVRSIIAQLISTAAARTVASRLETALAPAGLSADALAGAAEGVLRGAGLSRSKVAALRDLAERTRTRVLPLDRFDELSTEEVTAHLTAVRGIGPWTAEMFLIFSLGRLDVLPLADFGLRAGVRDIYGLADLPKPAELQRRAETWRPYRTVATWYFWRSRGGVPQSEPPAD